MELIASSRIVKAQNRMKSSESYFGLLSEIVQDLINNGAVGHVMLSLLLASAYFFIVQPGGVEYLIARAPIGAAWFTLGLAIYGFELIVSILQAYIFTLLSAVYIQTSLHPEH
jgi:F-type H+-transporting ATPase subunit a